MLPLQMCSFAVAFGRNDVERVKIKGNRLKSIPRTGQGDNGMKLSRSCTLKKVF